ncbi:MAG TPA: hypothetical protein VIY86_10695 [Pirellulaceae bacterium]
MTYDNSIDARGPYRPWGDIHFLLGREKRRSPNTTNPQVLQEAVKNLFPESGGLWVSINHVDGGVRTSDNLGVTIKQMDMWGNNNNQLELPEVPGGLAVARSSTSSGISASSR